MKSKSLKAIQTLVKIGRIISKIIFIFCIVGAAGCVLGILSLALIPGDFRVGEMTLRELIETKSGVTFGTMYTSMAAGIVPCAGEAVLAKLAERCLKRELDAGTPFTFAGAKDLITLGICAVCITVGTAITAGIVTGIMKNFFEQLLRAVPVLYRPGLALLLDNRFFRDIICLEHQFLESGHGKEQSFQIPYLSERRTAGSTCKNIRLCSIHV